MLDPGSGCALEYAVKLGTLALFCLPNAISSRVVGDFLAVLPRRDAAVSGHRLPFPASVALGQLHPQAEAPRLGNRSLHRLLEPVGV